MVKRLNDLQGKILINLFALLEVHTDNIDFIFLEILKLMRQPYRCLNIRKCGCDFLERYAGSVTKLVGYVNSEVQLMLLRKGIYFVMC